MGTYGKYEAPEAMLQQGLTRWRNADQVECYDDARVDKTIYYIYDTTDFESLALDYANLNRYIYRIQLEGK